MTLMELVLVSTVQVSLVVLGALVATALLRRRSAAVRHWIISVAIVWAAAMPLLGLIVPSWHLPLGLSPSTSQMQHPRTFEAASAQPPPALAEPVRERGGPGRSAPLDAARIVTAGHVLGSIWMAGVGLSLFILLAGLARLAWLAGGSERVGSGEWRTLAEEISRAYGLRRPVLLLQSNHPTLLVTWGFVRPKVILPLSAPDWPEDRIRIVLCHELAHIRRGDWLAQMAAELLRCVYWFNPLLWIACRRLRLESEQACDDAVLNGGIDGSNYATHLLDLARALGRQRRTWLAAPAMARPCSLERRISAMLNARLNHNPITRTARVLIVIASLGIAVPAAGLVQTASARLSGSVHDSLGGAWSGVALGLSHLQSGETFSTRSSEAGTFEFAGLPAGEYRLEARLPGFAPFEETVTLAAGQRMQRKIALELGRVTERTTVSDDAGSVPSARDTSRAHEMIDRFRGRPLQPPIKVQHVQPAYPEALRGTGVEGEVTLEGYIGTDGLVNVKRVLAPVHPDSLAPVHPDLARAAVEAVRQWQFEPTRLHGGPVDTRITVIVNFVGDGRDQ